MLAAGIPQPLKVEGTAGGTPVEVLLIAGAATVGKVDQGLGGASAWKVDGSAVTQPVSGTVAVSSLPGSPAQEHTGAASPHAARLSDGSAFYDAAKTGQLPAALAAGGGLKVEGVAGGVVIPISGTVAVSGTVTVAGTVAVSSLPGSPAQEHTTAASPHSARLSDGAAFYDAAKTGQLPAALAAGGGLKVEGVAGGVAVPISVASLPLPSGAATEATLSALNTKVVAVNTGAVVVTTLPGSPAQEHVTAASPHSARLSDGTAFYDAAKTGQLPAALAAGGGLKIEGVAGGVAVPISAASLPLPTGAATLAEQQTQTTHLSTLAGTTLVDNAGFVDGTSRVIPTGYIFDAVAGPALTENDVAAARIDSKRAQINVIEDGTTRGRVLTIVLGGAALVDANIVDNAAFTDGTTRVFPIGGVFDETAGTALTENDVAAPRIDSKRGLIAVIEDETTRGRRLTITAANAMKVDGSAVTQPVADAANKVEDAAHSSGQTGQFILGVRNDNAGSTRTDTDGDYSPASVDDRGRQFAVCHAGKATSTDDYTGTATGTAVNVSHMPLKHFALQVSGVGGTPTAWTVLLEGSLDGTTYTLIATHTASADALGSTEPTVTFTPYNFIRSRAGGITLNGATALRVIWIGVT